MLERLKGISLIRVGQFTSKMEAVKILKEKVSWQEARDLGAARAGWISCHLFFLVVFLLVYLYTIQLRLKFSVYGSWSVILCQSILLQQT